MNKKTKSVVAVIIAMSAAGLATQLVSWHTFPKACLAAGVAGIVMAILLFTVPNEKEVK
jgi:hypothetical protein